MDKDDYRIISNINQRHYERIRDKLIEQDRELRAHRKMIFAMYLIIVLMLSLIGICFAEVERAKAGVIGLDESLGGFSYMIDCLEKNDIPEDYKKILRMWHPAYNITQDEYDILVRSCCQHKPVSNMIFVVSPIDDASNCPHYRPYPKEAIK